MLDTVQDSRICCLNAIGRKRLVRSILFATFVGGTVLAVIPALLFYFHFELRNFDAGAWRLVGLFPIGVGAALGGNAIWNFVRVGSGTPAPGQPPTTLVYVGPHKYVRNPSYLGAVLIAIGEALLFGSLSLLLYSVLIFTALHLLLIYIEEPRLRQRFGIEYGMYCRLVPRWIPTKLFTRDTTRQQKTSSSRATTVKD